MKKFIILIAAFAIVIIASGLLFNYYLNNVTEQLTKDIENIENSVQSGDYNSATHILSEFEREWNKKEYVLAMFIDHYEIDTINNSMAKMSVYLRFKDNVNFFSESGALKLNIDHIYKKEQVNLKNVL